MSVCMFCQKWIGERREPDAINYCKEHKIVIRGCRHSCDEFKLRED